tara:strand:- start:446 stop:859 length:414 start_codon:yes stop_codon:yes gene_type:complete
MKVTKKQLKNGKFEYTANYDNKNVIIIKSSTKEFVEVLIQKYENGSIRKMSSTTNYKNNLKNDVEIYKSLSQHKGTFHICKVECEKLEVKKDVSSTVKVKFSKIGGSFVKQWFDNNKNCFQYDFFKTEVDFLNAQNK